MIRLIGAAGTLLGIALVALPLLIRRDAFARRELDVVESAFLVIMGLIITFYFGAVLVLGR
jgi:ABC-type microcin C transport system permease subunit YejB